jgi:hypothetical protein
MAVDYTRFGPNGPPSDPASPTSETLQWWKLKGEDAASSITAILRYLADNQSARLGQQVVSVRLYGNLSMTGVNGLALSRSPVSQPAVRDRITYNVIASCIDTITAKIGKNKPKPLFLTSGGDYKLQRKAKKLNQFVDGIFYENKAYQLGVEIFRDGCVFGTGVGHVFIRDGRICFERVVPSELFVDEVEAFYGRPRSLHRIKNVDRYVLADAFPEARKMIMDCNGAMVNEAGSIASLSDMVTVRESWHLPSGPEASDGRHTITLENGTILSEKYTHDFFPFAFFHWSKRLFGFWGQGLAEQLQNIQFEINKLLILIQRSMHLAGTFKVLMENTSKIVTEHLSNEIGAVVRYTGTPPQYVTPPAVQPEIYQHLMTLKQSAYEQSGISALSAAAQKPAGLNSGKALREYNDIESDRFQTVGKAYEEFYLDLAKLSIAMVKQLVEEEGDFSIAAPGKKFLQTIKWSDIDLDDEEYVMQCYPVSSLPNDPAGRLQTIQEYLQAGFLTPRQGRMLLDFPDLEQVEGLANAMEEWLTSTLDKMVDDGEYTSPEPFDDLTLARELALEYYSRGKTQSVEEERLELLRRFISQIDELQKMAQPPAPPPGAEPMPQAVPEPPPQSPMLPNVPGMQ